MSEPQIGITHEKLISAFAGVNRMDELGQLREKATIIARLEGKKVSPEIVESNFDQLLEASKAKANADEGEQLEYPEDI